MKAVRFRTLTDYVSAWCGNAARTNTFRPLLHQCGEAGKNRIWIRKVSTWLQQSSRNAPRKSESIPATCVHTYTNNLSFNPLMPTPHRYYVGVSEDLREPFEIHAGSEESTEDRRNNARTTFRKQKFRPAKNEPRSKLRFGSKEKKSGYATENVHLKLVKHMCQDLADLRRVRDNDGMDSFEANPPFEMMRSMQDLELFIKDVDPWVQWSLRDTPFRVFAFINSLVMQINSNQDKFGNHSSELPPNVSSGAVAMEVLDFLYKYLTSSRQLLRFLALTIYGKYTAQHVHRGEAYKLSLALGYFEEQGEYKQFRTWLHKGLEEFVQERCNDETEMIRFLERYRMLQSGFTMERAYTGFALINMTSPYQTMDVDKLEPPPDMAALQAWCCKVSLKDASKELLITSMMTLGRLEFIHVLPAFVSDWLTRYEAIRESFTLKDIIPCGIYIPRTISRTQPNPLLDDLCTSFEAYCMSRNARTESEDARSGLYSASDSDFVDAAELSARELSMVLYLFYNSPYRPSQYFYDIWEKEFIYALERQGLNLPQLQIRPIDIIQVTLGLSTLYGFAPSSQFWKLWSRETREMLPQMYPVQLAMLVRGLAVLPSVPSIISTADYDDLISAWHESFARNASIFDSVSYQTCAERVMCSSGLLGIFEPHALTVAFSKVASMLGTRDLVNNFSYFERLGLKTNKAVFRLWDATLSVRLGNNDQLGVYELCILWQCAVRLNYRFSDELVGHMFSRFRVQPRSKRDHEILDSAHLLVLLTDFVAHFKIWNDMTQRYWLAMSDRILSHATTSELQHMKTKIEEIMAADGTLVHASETADGSQHLLRATVTNTWEPDPKVAWERLAHQLKLTSEVSDVASRLRALQSKTLNIPSSEETADPA